MTHVNLQIRRKWLLVIALVAMACNPDAKSEGAGADRSDASLARREVEAAIDSSNAAIERADIDAILRGFADDFVLRRADGIVRGREAMRAVWEENFRGWIYQESRITIERFSSSTDLAVASGTVGGLLRPKDRPASAPADTFALPYLAEWGRLPDGRWVMRDLAVIYPAR